MISRGSSSNKSLLQILLLALLLAFTAASAWAQDAAEDDEEDTTEQEESADLDKVVVTGSRLQRETYTSISPLQIITAEGSREAGLIDSAEILQKSTASSGQQIDLSFTGFVLDNGPGASTVDLRGLGAGRTLVLLNGRRLAPSGVEGAPAAPDLNLIPGSLVSRYEVLLDGASSVYGSDAVAGVTNVIMRKDFDGFEFDVFLNEPDHSNGRSYNVNAVYGMNFDRGMFGIGVEYQNTDEIQVRDRPWTGQCDKHHEITTAGEIRSQEQFYNNVYGMEWDECRLGLLAGRVFVPTNSGSIYHTPGMSNGGWGNWSESSQYGFGIDSNGDGVADLSFRDYDLNGKDSWQSTSLWPDAERISIMAYGEYVFDGDMNNTPYFEFNYNDRDFMANSGEPQLFPIVPANNPYNLCNPDAINGVDCGLAEDELYNNPGYRAQFSNRWAGLCAQFGIPPEGCSPEVFGLYNGEIGPVFTQPIASVRGDRNFVTTTMEQVRGVIGMKGDLPFIDFGSMSSWVYDVALVHTDSSGTSSRDGIRDDRLDLSLGVFSSTTTPCQNDLGVELDTDVAPGCVPVNMFAPSLYPVGVVTGDFATQAERDYLFDSRDFTTDYTQTLFSAYANGFVFELPGGTAMAGLGFEWRRDEIKSIPDNVARDGLFFGFFADGGAEGQKDTTELFGEVELPILAGMTGAEELTLNMSARWTDDEIYGDDWTYSLKLGYRPVNSLLLRGTYGTSFRAPNLREVFLRAQTGFNNSLFDPCIVPEEARSPIDGTYLPDLDRRDPVILENCARNGIDPGELDNNGNQIVSAEVAQGGSLDLTAETSVSYTYGFAFEQPWWEAFDLTFGVTYYDIDIDDTIIEPSSQFIVNDCYGDTTFNSSFCSRINRDSDNFIDLIDAGFINRDNARNRGFDYNLNYDQNFNVGATALRFGVDLAVNQNKEASTTFVSDEGEADFEDLHGNIYYPEWKGNLGLRLNVNDVRFTWVTNYIGSTSQVEADIDDWSDAFTSSDTCFGPPDDFLCRDYADTDEYWLHSASVYYYGDTITLGVGVRNVFDESPPLIDGTEHIAANRVPLGAGYDIFGRVYFVNFVWRP
jgi:iron complex outermembrane receptor protein